jgi:hypothetical protein
MEKLAEFTSRRGVSQRLSQRLRKYFHVYWKQHRYVNSSTYKAHKKGHVRSHHMMMPPKPLHPQPKSVSVPDCSPPCPAVPY